MNWNRPFEVLLSAGEAAGGDEGGQPVQTYPDQPHVLNNQIQGPLIIEGSTIPGKDRSLKIAVKLATETDSALPVLGIDVDESHQVDKLNVYNDGSITDDHARLAVAERDGRIQLGTHRVERGHEAIRAHLVEYLTNLVGLAARLGEQVGTAELHEHPLRACGHQSGAGLDQDVGSGDGGRDGDIDNSSGAVVETLQELFHDGERRGIIIARGIYRIRFRSSVTHSHEARRYLEDHRSTRTSRVS